MLEQIVEAVLTVAFKVLAAEITRRAGEFQADYAVKLLKEAKTDAQKSEARTALIKAWHSSNG